MSQTFSVCPGAAEVASLFDALVPRQTEGGEWHEMLLRGDQTGVRRFLPTRRRLAKMARPLFEELRLRKPCCLLRLIFEG